MYANQWYTVMMKCYTCKKELVSRWQVKYCSNKCQSDYQYSVYIKKWKEKLVDGSRGVSTRNISRYLKRYLIEKFGEKCIQCGWNAIHPVSGNAPLEIDHIDGDSENNNEKNLRLLCPNCHSITINFKNYNIGKGRVWRKVKYVKN